MINPDKTLLQFKFSFTHPTNTDSLVSENYLFSRAVLESLFVRTKASIVKLESACGTLNPYFFRDQTLGLKQSFPEHGVKLFIDANADYEMILESLNEVTYSTLQSGVCVFYLSNPAFRFISANNVFDYANNIFDYANNSFQ